MRTIARVITALSVMQVVSPALFAQCRTPTCQPKQVVVPVVQQIVPVAVQVPTYSATYSSYEAGILEKLERIAVALERGGGAQGVAAVTHVSIIQNRCSGCHEAQVAEGKGGGFVMWDAKGLPPFSLPEKRRIKELVKTGAMPPSGPLTEDEKRVINEWLDGKKQPAPATSGSGS